MLCVCCVLCALFVLLVYKFAVVTPTPPPPPSQQTTNFLLQQENTRQQHTIYSRWVPSSAAYVFSPARYRSASLARACIYTSPLHLHRLTQLPPQITSVFRTIGSAIMAVISAIGAAVKAVVDGIVSLFAIVIGCLTCGTCGGRSRRVRTTSRV